MTNRLVSIVIPIYKENPGDKELLSLKQCCKILGRYSIRLVAPMNLNTNIYDSVCENIIDYSIERFNDCFFENVSGYNKLLLSPEFYRRFEHSEYILIYQLDAYVFRDELEYWCNRGYDYIGAPWYFKGANKWAHDKEFTAFLPFRSRYRYIFKIFYWKDRMVGNGGFSLRRVQKHLETVQKFEKIISAWTSHEDIFFGMYVKSFDFTFHTPGIRKALRFSVEQAPAQGVKKLRGKLPFGCHAWPMHGFWKQYIPVG